MLRQMMDFLAVWTLVAFILAPIVGAFLGLGERSVDVDERADERMDPAA